MITYEVSEAELMSAIELVSGTWFTKAARRTQAYEDARPQRYVDSPGPIWSEIKSVFMEAQGFKCGFCERALERSPFGNVEHDVEHFRPKGLINAWTPTEINGIPVVAMNDRSSKRGYFFLAHNPLNYLIACKTCNTGLKQNFFPTRMGRRNVRLKNPPTGVNLDAEYLLHPIGNTGIAAEDLIRFEGVVPVPAGSTPAEVERALVIIDLFQLDDRQGLQEERAAIIVGLFIGLNVLDPRSPAISHGETVREAATRSVANALADHAPHANCARSFERLWREDSAAATQFAVESYNLLRTLP